jgi:hypothetical protein
MEREPQKSGRFLIGEGEALAQEVGDLLPFAASTLY